MKIELDVSMDNEGTNAPWWMIVDPCQMMSPNAAEVAMGMVTGPFFSREEAKSELTNRRYDYGSDAVVWCASGCNTKQYLQAWREAEDLLKELDND